MRRLFVVAWMIAGALLAACGGSRDSIVGATSTTSTSTGTGTTTTTTTPTVVPASLTAISSTPSIPPDGSAMATITVLARNSANDLISGVVVTFAADSGGLAVTQATTDATGSALATLSTAGDSTPRTITVTATASGLSATVKVQVVAASAAVTTAVSSLTMSTSAASILTDDSTTATISALALDAANNTMAGVPVTFAASSGAVQVTRATTDATGTALATLSTGEDPTARTITVTGGTAALSSTVQVPVIPAAVYTMGNGSGTGFTASAIGIAVTGNLAAGGRTGLQVSIVDQTGTLYSTAPVTVAFNSPCIASGTAVILASGGSAPVTTITTASGSINASYAAEGCSGPDRITASAMVTKTQSLSATGTVTVSPASIGSIQFVAASPTTIGLKGTGLNETSTVTFKVTDSGGNARTGVPVTFALDSTVGGMSLSPASATSLSDGTVQTVVSSGTVHTAVRVTASIASPALSTQSSDLAVTTGLPSSSAFSISVGAATYGAAPATLACPNVEAAGIDGVTVPVTVRLADRYNNPVPDGTAVAFYTNGGHIVGSCATSAVSGDGTCSVTWTSASPRPATTDVPPVRANGRAQILATAVGEESFTDDNGSGYYQSPDPFAHLGEPFLSANESGVYVLGDYFIDYNHNGKYDGPGTTFIGITCTGGSPTVPLTCAPTQSMPSLLAIGVSHLMIMSTSGAVTSYIAAGSTNFTNTGTATNPVVSIPPGSGTVEINVQDGNSNSMGAGTTIAFAFSPATVGTISQTPSPFVVGCNADLGGQDYQASFTALTPGSGSISVTITSPSGTATVFNIPVTVTGP